MRRTIQLFLRLVMLLVTVALIIGVPILFFTTLADVWNGVGNYVMSTGESYGFAYFCALFTSCGYFFLCFSVEAVGLASLSLWS